MARRAMTLSDFEELGLTSRVCDQGAPLLAYSEGPPRGTKLVLVHGLSGRRDSFLKVLPELIKHFHVFALDLRGHGKSGRTPHHYALRDYANDVQCFLERVVGPGSIVWGQSLGAAASLLALCRRPELAVGVVLEEPPLVKAPPNSMGSVFEFWHSLVKQKLDISALEEALRAQGGLSPFQVSYKAETLADLDPDVLASALAGEITSTDLLGLLPRLSLPTLLIQGDPASGGIIPHAVIAGLQPLPANITHHALLGVGHKPHDEVPGATVELVLGWSETLSAPKTECGMCAFVAGKLKEEIVFENELWQVRSLPGAVPIPGWLMLVSKRHVAGPFDFNDAEALSFGPTLRHLSRQLRKLTGASRIYVAALGEAHPHLHCHLVPRTEDLPGAAKGWSVFDLQRQAVEGSIPVDRAQVLAMLTEIKAALLHEPLP